MKYCITSIFMILSLSVSALAAEFALVDQSNVILQFGEFASQPNNPIGKNWRWLPVQITNPAFDAVTQIKTGPVITVEAFMVTKVWTVRNKTAQELDDDKTGLVDGIGIATFRALCHLKNETRRLENLSAWTQAQCFTAFKGLIP